MREPSDMTAQELTAAINVGTLKFAWLPTRVRTESGWFRDGFVWLQWVRRLRHIGFPTYYYVRRT